MRISRFLAALICFAVFSITLEHKALADPPLGDPQGWRYEPKKPSVGGQKSGVWDDGQKPTVPADKAGATSIEYGKGVKPTNPAAGIWDDGQKPVAPGQ